MFKKFFCLCLLIGAFAMFNELPSASALPQEAEDKEPDATEEPADEEVDEPQEVVLPAEEDLGDDLLDEEPEEPEEAETDSPPSSE